MHMRSVDDLIHKYIGPNEKIEKIYHQSEYYLKENPLNSVLNLLMIASFVINAIIVVVLKHIGFSKDNPIEIAIIGAIFYGFNLLILVPYFVVKCLVFDIVTLARLMMTTMMTMMICILKIATPYI